MTDEQYEGICTRMYSLYVVLLVIVVMLSLITGKVCCQDTTKAKKDSTIFQLLDIDSAYVVEASFTPRSDLPRNPAHPIILLPVGDIIKITRVDTPTFWWRYYPSEVFLRYRSLALNKTYRMELGRLMELLNSNLIRRKR